MTSPGGAQGSRVAYVDLHTHSTASDGALPPEEVVAAARAAGLAAIALTDHDALDGVAPARAAGERLGVRVIAGTELSAYDGERTYGGQAGYGGSTTRGAYTGGQYGRPDDPDRVGRDVGVDEGTDDQADTGSGQGER